MPSPSIWKIRLSGVFNIDSPRIACLTKLVAFYDFITGQGDGGRAVDVVQHYFNKVLDTVSHNILIWKLRNCGINEWTLRWTESRLTGRAQRIVSRHTESSLRPVNSSVSQRSVLGPVLFNISSMTCMKG